MTKYLIWPLLTAKRTYENWASTWEPYLMDFRNGHTQTSLLDNRGYLENWNFASSNYGYDTFQQANNKGADQPIFCCCKSKKDGKDPETI